MVLGSMLGKFSGNLLICAMIPRILRAIWAIYGTIYFVVQLSIFLPIFWVMVRIFGKRVERLVIWLAHHWIGKSTLFVTGVWRRVHNKDLVRQGEPYIIVSNHRSFLDILIDAAAYPGVYKFLSKKEMVKVPVFGIIVKRLCILVDRSSKESRQESYNNMKAALEDGYSVLLYPEGTRNRTDAPLKDFYDGAFRLASETGYPLAVITMDDPGKLNTPLRTLDLSPGWVDVTWAVIPETKGLDLEILKAQTRALMLKALKRSEN